MAPSFGVLLIRHTLRTLAFLKHHPFDRCPLLAACRIYQPGGGSA